MTERQRRNLWATGAAGWAALIAWASHQSSPFPMLPSELLSQDKLLHAFAFGTLAFLVRRALAAVGLGALRAFLLAWGLSMGWAVLDEFHQSFIPHRVSDVYDAVADGAGALIGAWLAAARLRRVKSGASIRA